MSRIIGYVNGLPIEERAGTAHDPATGQFTSGGGGTTHIPSAKALGGIHIGEGSPNHAAWKASGGVINPHTRYLDAVKKGKSEHRDPAKKGFYTSPATGAAFNKSAEAYAHSVKAHSKEEHAAAYKAHSDAIAAHQEVSSKKNARQNIKHDAEIRIHKTLQSYHKNMSV